MNAQNVKFEDYINDISYIRNTVFVDELKIPKSLEWDSFDKSAHHFIVTSDQGSTIAYARLLPSGKLGRVAVLAAWRGQGIGTLLVTAICEMASKLDINKINLSAQLTAVNFYLNLGFKTTGDTFFEAGIEHRTMYKTVM